MKRAIKFGVYNIIYLAKIAKKGKVLVDFFVEVQLFALALEQVL